MTTFPSTSCFPNDFWITVLYMLVYIKYMEASVRSTSTKRATNISVIIYISLFAGDIFLQE
jgi:hypothetical protein